MRNACIVYVAGKGCGVKPRRSVRLLDGHSVAETDLEADMAV